MANLPDMCKVDVTDYLILTAIAVYVNCMIHFNTGRN